MLFKIIVLLILSVFGNQADDSTRKKCTLESSEPDYQPNIYLCSDGYSCCRVYGKPACCAEDIQLSEEWKNLLFTSLFALVALFVAWAIQCYFNDDDPCDSKFASEECKRPSTYNEYTKKNEVDDPIFGPRICEETPKYAGLHGYEDRGRLRAFMDSTNDDEY